MSNAYHLALLGMLLSSPALLWPHVTGPAVTRRSGLPARTREATKENSAGISEASRSQGTLRRRAEVAAQKAARLREKQTARDFVAASKLFQESARLFAAGRSYDEAADSHIQTGEIYSTLSQYDEARKSFRQALKLGNNPELQCRALSGIARTYASTGPYSLADSYSKHALSRCERVNEKAHAEALEARGEALDSAGEHSRSADSFKRARDLFAAANDDNGQAQTLLMLAYALFSGGERAQGLQAAGQALRLWSSTENRAGVAQARAALGIFAITTGEFETAQCDYSVARPLFHEIGDKDNEASVLNGLGYVNRETGDWQQSLKFYQNAKAIFASVQDLLGEHEAITGMGKALTAMKNYQQLLPLYQAELRLGRQANNAVLVASAMADIAGVYEAENKYAQAETFYRRSLEAYRATDHLYGEGDILMRLGHLQANQRKYSQAIASLDRANELKEQTSQVEEVAKIQYELACIYRRLNRLEDARSAVEKTIEIVENQRVTIAHFDSRASYFASVHRYYALYIQVLMLLHRREPDLGFAERAFDASERSKVRSLLDLLTTSSQEAPCDELLQRQLGITDATEVHAVDAKQAASSTAPTLTLKQVQAEIEGDDTVLLEYALGDDKSYVWVIDQRQMTSYELPPAEQIRKIVELVRGTLPAPQLRDGESAGLYQARVREVDHAYQFHARQLSELLLWPIVSAEAKRVLIVPDGSLQYIPFAALPFPGPGLSKGLLVNHYEIDVLPSASVLGTLRKATAKRTPPTAIAAIFADPVFERDDPRVSSSRAGGERSMQERPPALTRAVRDMGASQYIARLPASRDEASAIATILRSRDSQGVHIALDFDASRDYVLRDGLARFRLVHFATHGVVDARHPEMSGLILSLIDRRGRKQDGYLRLGDIYKLKLSADLVVLSSCDSALGKDLDSEGIIGLPRGFLYAGARSVIASLWKVSDEATARLMSGLYTRIQRGESPGSALRGAQLEIAREEQWSKPYYWAAFVLQGDYR
jgi:CHAT domain-containing protein